MDIQIFSHPRSGTNMLRSLLNVSLYGAEKSALAVTGHWSDRVCVMAPTGFNPSHNLYKGGKGIYLLRDGRDVALSLFRTKGFQHKSWHNLSFREFLSRPLDWFGSPGAKADSGLTIVEHWKAHLDSWCNRPDVLYIRYENLLADPLKQLQAISIFYELDFEYTVERVGPAGPFPSNDFRARKWIVKFSSKELNLFHRIVKHNYWGLWM